MAGWGAELCIVHVLVLVLLVHVQYSTVLFLLKSGLTITVVYYSQCRRYEQLAAVTSSSELFPTVYMIVHVLTKDVHTPYCI